MPRRRTRGQGSGVGTKKVPGDWRPIKCIQVDVDAPSGSARPELVVGDRVWIEAIKHGQVVGVMQARADVDGLPISVEDEVVTAFKDFELSSPAPIPEEMLSRASIVVPTLCRNPPELVRTVESLLEQDYPDFEVIVVDNRTDIDCAPLPEFPRDDRLRTYAERKPGVSAARNLGVRMSTSDLVVFTDDDAAAAPNWLRAIGTRFAADTEVEAIGGLVLPMELETEPQLWFEEFYGGFSPSFCAEKLSIERLKGVDEMFPYAVGRFGAGCNMAYRRLTLNRLGGFDICLGGGTLARAGEDLLVAIELVAAGGTYAYEPAALVRHCHRRTEAEFLKQVFNYGTGLTALYTALIIKDPRHLVRIIRRIPSGLKHLTRSPAERSTSFEPSYPRRTLSYQVLGMVYGPIAYFRSCIRTHWFD